jgi:hypothetical protein
MSIQTTTNTGDKCADDESHHFIVHYINPHQLSSMIICLNSGKGTTDTAIVDTYTESNNKNQND